MAIKLMESADDVGRPVGRKEKKMQPGTHSYDCHWLPNLSLSLSLSLFLFLFLSLSLHSKNFVLAHFFASFFYVHFSPVVPISTVSNIIKLQSA
jgi:hypothetical protein